MCLLQAVQFVIDPDENIRQKMQQTLAMERHDPPPT